VATGVPLDELPPSVLYDVFQDSASVLTGLYLERERGASDAPEAADWWAKVTALRERMRAMDPDDRAGLVDHVTRWRSEAADLTP
jgi:hypothetical protein